MRVRSKRWAEVRLSRVQQRSQHLETLGVRAEEERTVGTRWLGADQVGIRAEGRVLPGAVTQYPSLASLGNCSHRGQLHPSKVSTYNTCTRHYKKLQPLLNKKEAGDR